LVFSVAHQDAATAINRGPAPLKTGDALEGLGVHVTSDGIGRRSGPALARRLLAARKKFALCERKSFTILKVFAIMGQPR
jgi:hypothetical protein